jgi:hypothetical protein
MRAMAIIYCLQIKGLQVYLFRRTHPDLIANHMNGSGSFPELLAQMMDSGQVTINHSKGEIAFDNGSKIHLCHCQHEKDMYKYQGAEIHVLLIDELTHFTEAIYRFLRNRVRIGGLQIPDNLKGKIPLIFNGSNPGSVGHQWVKATFVNFAKPFEVKTAPDNEGGMNRQFIPARLDDNQILVENDPMYIKRLEGLGNEALVRAMRDGDWDITAGAAFEKLSRKTHMIRPIKIPEHWTKFTSLDWGTARPYSLGWYAVVDEDIYIKGLDGEKGQPIGKGSIIRYKELYGCITPDVGTREESWEVARKLHDMEMEHIDYRIADSAMWNEHDGPSAAENFMNELARIGNQHPFLEKSRKDRMGNYLECRNRIAQSNGEYPGFYITSNCEHFWRTVPDLQLDERDPEKGWDTHQEDHVGDEVAYGLVSRPKLMTLHERNEIEYHRAQRKSHRAAGTQKTGRYS